jgi:hypothetical protein
MPSEKGKSRKTKNIILDQIKEMEKFFINSQIDLPTALSCMHTLSAILAHRMDIPFDEYSEYIQRITRKQKRIWDNIPIEPSKRPKT